MVAEKAEMVKRFGSGRIVEHWLHMLSFFGLAATGLCQKFFYLEPCRMFIGFVGGIDAMRFMHRGFGLLFAALLVAHVLVALMGMFFYRWQSTMFVGKRDLENVVHNIKYYTGLRQRPAECGRYDYKQKFVYWLTLSGAAIMLCSGMALWFPVETANLLPGQVIPAAKVMHSSHALLIFLLIALWHMYDSVFSPDVFPLDRSIFTGYITKERLCEEHPLECEKLLGTQDLLEEGQGDNDNAEQDLPGP